MTSRVALVTGAGSGIGRAAAQRLAQNGYRMILVGRRAAPLDELSAAIGSECLSITADVSDAASVKALFARIERQFGRLDLLFNNAGVSMKPSAIEDLAPEEWDRIMATNVRGVFLCTQAAFKLMKSQQPQGGRIINYGSVSAATPRPHLIAYTASKHAVAGLTKSTALEGRQYDIACGQIDIGNTATDMANHMASGTLQADLSLDIEPTFDVSHVADAVLYMANLPLTANVLFMTLMATKMPLVGRG
jgi:NAD(P)-dependent dehydrogenase (short-subunit alcohol dehydrogenase family)